MGLVWDILLRYHFIQRNELKDRSLTALVVGITRMREAKVHTAGISALGGGENSRR